MLDCTAHMVGILYNGCRYGHVRIRQGSQAKTHATIGNTTGIFNYTNKGIFTTFPECSAHLLGSTLRISPVLQCPPPSGGVSQRSPQADLPNILQQVTENCWQPLFLPLWGQLTL